MLWLILIHIHTRYSCRKSVNGNYSVMRLIVNLIVVLTQWLSGAPEASQYPQIGFCDLAVAVAEHYTACSVCIKYIYTIHIHIHTYIYIYQWHTYIPWPHPQKQRFEIQKIITPSAVIFFFNFRVIIRPPWYQSHHFPTGSIMRLMTFHPPTPPLQVDELRKALQEQTQRVEDTTALRERMPKSPEGHGHRKSQRPWVQVDNLQPSLKVAPKSGRSIYLALSVYIGIQIQGSCFWCSFWLVSFRQIFQAGFCEGKLQ